MRFNTLLGKLCPLAGAAAVLALLASASDGQDPGGPFKVTITDGKPQLGELVLPIDLTPRAVAQHGGSFAFGIAVDKKRITFSEQESIWCDVRVDGQQFQLAFGGPGGPAQSKPLAPGKFNKKRTGFQTIWTNNEIRVTQIVELVPSKTSSNQMRLMDTYRITYVVENIAKDGRTRKIEFKTEIDTLIVANDGALFASPTTHPGKVLNGIALRGKDMPDYVQVLERPDLNNPGFVAYLTFKHSKGDNPDVFIMTTTAQIFQGWEPPPQPAGDSACCVLWKAKDVKAGEKRTMVFAYGGGIATDPENDGVVKVALGGSFEPNKLFTITAQVEDPAPNQVLTLELPDGMERVEGREVQPVPLPLESTTSVVMWKARVLRTGEFDVRVRSSTGVTQVKHVSIQPAAAN